MIRLWEMALGWSDFYRRVSEVGISVLAQSTALLLLGLLMARVLRCRGPSAQSAVYKATLLAVVVCAALSVALAGRVVALWTFTLPAPESAPVAYTLPEALPANSAAADTLTPTTALTASATAPADNVIEPEPASASAGEGIAWPYAIGVGIWAAGAIMLLAWLGFLPDLPLPPAPVRCARSGGGNCCVAGRTLRVLAHSSAADDGRAARPQPVPGGFVPTGDFPPSFLCGGFRRGGPARRSGP